MLTVLLTACGDTLVRGDYRGDPLLTVRGPIFLDSSVGLQQRPMSAGLAWAGPRRELAVRQQPVELLVEATAWYEAAIYNDPPSTATLVSSWVQEPVSIGVIVLFVDQEGDRLWSGTEPVVAVGREVLILHASEGLGELEPGYHLVQLPEGPCEAGTLSVDSPLQLEVPLETPWEAGQMVDLDCDGTLAEWAGLILPGGG